MRKDAQQSRNAVKMEVLRLPKLFQTHRREDMIIINQWHVQIGQIVNGDDLLLTVDTPPGVCEIYAPERKIKTPHRVCRLEGSVGEEIRLGATFITLEPVSP